MNSPETPFRITPCRLENAGGTLLDLISDIRAAASRLGDRLHPKTAADLADRVRIMNSYYSNLIEDHFTRPRDIERAMQSAPEPDQGAGRHSQIEAAAHVRLQRSIDERFRAHQLPDPVSVDYLCALHRDFYEGIPSDMLEITGAGRTFTMVPGELRSRHDHDNAVGQHVPPSSAVVRQFMEYFERAYALTSLSSAQQLLVLPCAHHRFNYIHPFPDGNGRVSRLMSHSMALCAGIGAQGLWSISRGLARGLLPGADGRAQYKQMLAYADSPRFGDLDGRGNLSEKALVEFSVWFLQVCLDQIKFMSEQFQLGSLTDRLSDYAEKKFKRKQAAVLLTEVLHRGEVSRGDAVLITGLKERTGRELLREIIADGILGSDSPKTPVSLRFQVHALEQLFPQLYPADAR